MVFKNFSFYFLDPPGFSVGRQKRYATSSHVQMTSFVKVCNVKSIEKGYACLKILNES